MLDEVGVILGEATSRCVFVGGSRGQDWIDGALPTISRAGARRAGGLA